MRTHTYNTQEEIIPFFQSMTLSKESTNPIDCYLEMAEKVRRLCIILCFLVHSFLPLTTTCLNVT